MAGKTPAEAVENFLEPLRRALLCVTNEILLVGGGYYPSDTPHAVTLSNSPAKLGSDRRFAFKMIQHYRIIEYEGAHGPWQVRTVAYYYTLEEANDLQREIFAYHWHPQGHSKITYPHFHLYEGAGIREYNIVQAHFPTGRMAIEDVLRLAITHFGVRPLRQGWESILDTTQGAFEEWRT